MSARGEAMVAAQQRDDRWWRSESESIADDMIRAVTYLRERQDYQRRNDLLHTQLYQDRPFVGFGLSAYARILDDDRISINVIQSNIDTLQAKICKNRPRPTFLVEDGDYAIKHQAEQLQKFAEGQLYESDFYETRPSIVLDACILGTGCVKVYEQSGRIKVDRCFKWELTVNDREARYGKPRNLYQKKYYDRAVLAELFPEYADDIFTASSDDDAEDVSFDYDDRSDQLLVWEAWHLPSAEKMGDRCDGRHVIAIRGCPKAMLDEVWEEPWFPFAFLRRNKPPIGFWGIGVAEQLMPIQEELGYLSRNIQECHHLVGKARVFLPRTAMVNPEHFANLNGAFVPYSGNKEPTIRAESGVPQDMYAYQQFLIQTASELSGVSRMAQAGTKPAGLDSAVALREYEDIQSERFVTFQGEDDAMVCEVTRLQIALARKMAKGSGYKVRSTVSGQSMEIVDLRDVDLREEEYFMKVLPSSMLPSTVAGKFAMVKTLSDMGMPANDAFALIGIPDTDKWLANENADRDVIEKNILSIKRDGVYVSPESVDNHELAMKLVRQAYHRARLDGVPEDRRALLLQYLEATVESMSPPPVNTGAAPPMPAGSMPMQGAPPPMAPPGDMGAMPPGGVMQ